VQVGRPQAESKDEMRRPTIFVTDDEMSERGAMGGMLQEEGWWVEVDSSGDTFLKAWSPRPRGVSRGRCSVATHERARAAGAPQDPGRRTAGHHDLRPCRHPTDSSSDKSVVAPPTPHHYRLSVGAKRSGDAHHGGDKLDHAQPKPGVRVQPNETLVYPAVDEAAKPTG
jgi:hypothetical protein